MASRALSHAQSPAAFRALSDWLHGSSLPESGPVWKQFCWTVFRGSFPSLTLPPVIEDSSGRSNSSPTLGIILPSYWEWISSSWWFEFAYPWWLTMLMWGGLASTWIVSFAKLPVRIFAPFYIGLSIFFSLICRVYSYFLHSFHVHIYCKYLLLCTLLLS